MMQKQPEVVSRSLRSNFSIKLQRFFGLGPLSRCVFVHHKCGTVYLGRVIGYMCRVANKELFKINDGVSILPSSEKLLFFPNGNYVTHITNSSLARYRGVHIVRDPRDVIVSGYFSHKFSHNTNNEWGENFLLNYRGWLNVASKDEALMREIKNGYALNDMNQWDYHDPHILKVKFEDLIKDPFIVFSQIFDFLKFDFDIEDLKKAIEKYSFKNLTQGRRPGEENKQHHFRKGIPGDWRNHFNADHIEYFKEKWGDLLIKLGYETDNDWG